MQVLFYVLLHVLFYLWSLLKTKLAGMDHPLHTYTQYEILYDSMYETWTMISDIKIWVNPTITKACSTFVPLVYYLNLSPSWTWFCMKYRRQLCLRKSGTALNIVLITISIINNCLADWLTDWLNEWINEWSAQEFVAQIGRRSTKVRLTLEKPHFCSNACLSPSSVSMRLA